MRLTTRQDFQLHGILKRDLRSSVREINSALLTTLVEVLAGEGHAAPSPALTALLSAV